jgi:hypothetical protein
MLLGEMSLVEMLLGESALYPYNNASIVHSCKSSDRRIGS